MGGAYGVSRMLGNNLCYAFAEPTLQTGKIHKGYRVGLGGRIGCAYILNDRLRMTTDLQAPVWYQGSTYLAPKASAGVQYNIHNALGVRVLGEYQSFKNHHHKNITAGFVWYFQ